jgi:regulatory protein
LDLDKIRARAKNNAYALLRQRPRSEFEIRSRLKLKGYGREVIDLVAEDLRRLGEIDDTRFVKLWIENRMHLNPVGDIVLRHELKVKGVAEPLIESALVKKSEEYDEYEVAFNMAREQFERFKKLDRKKAMKRAYDFLLRRGFKYETVRRIIENITNAD